MSRDATRLHKTTSHKSHLALLACLLSGLSKPGGTDAREREILLSFASRLSKLRRGSAERHAATPKAAGSTQEVSGNLYPGIWAVSTYLPAGISWYQLVPAGTSWSQLVPAGTQLVPAIPAGTS